MKYHHRDCTHDRHEPYRHLFSENCPEYTYLRHISQFVVDPNLSPEDPEDLEMFQDLLFDGHMGRIHIYYYEELFRDYYRFYPEDVVVTFIRYLVFLDKLSPLFTRDAYHFIFRKESPDLIDSLLEKMPFDIKMDFIKEAQKRQGIIPLSDKLKLYNLFS